MPNRIIKESICYSEDIDKLSPFEETVFYRLMVNVDDYGRIDARASYLKNMLYRTRENVTRKSIEDALRNLALIGLVRLYEVDGKPLLCLPKWECHQQIRAKKSKYPAPDRTCNQMISSEIICPRNPIQSESESESESGAAAPADARRKHGQFGWVKLADTEYQRLIADFGEETATHYITYVDESAQQTGNKNKWKDWNLTVRKAIKNKWGGNIQANPPNDDAERFRLIPDD